jgi:hypothetical protein
MIDQLAHIKGTGIEVIVAYIASNLIAQLAKVLTVAYRKRSFRWTIIFATGGMPSSHSSTVVAMATSIGLIEGFVSSMFAFTTCFAFIVMFDAAGLRRNASKQAHVLNRIIREFFSQESHLNTEKLKEFLGHTPLEVIVGGLLGVSVSVALHFWL